MKNWKIIKKKRKELILNISNKFKEIIDYLNEISET